jgi:hypothetical protein
MVYSHNPSTWEAEAKRIMSLRLAWATQQVEGQPGIYSETTKKQTANETKQKLLTL